MHLLLGGCEIENSVLEDLVKQPKLIEKEYGIIHFDSPDKRGIDVALLYQKKKFQPPVSNIPYTFTKKQVVQLKLKRPIPKKNR
jgi:hypothetical protein